MSTPAVTPATCPHCGAPRPASAEACPRCLLQLGLHLVPRDPEPSAPASRPAPASGATPSAEDLAAAFPGLQIEDEIGRGGMGVVYRARQRKLDRTVALKILAPELSGDPAFAERFLREARALARLSHEHIVAVHDFGETDGLCWILMEHVDGVDLRRAMETGRLTPERALAIVPQVCDALSCAHELGIVHRDIKPENVLLDREGRAKIADFGLAKLVDPSGTQGSLTAVAQAMGTPQYMAPEQMKGARDVDHRADIFSLGVVFYEMLTGQLPVGRFDPPSKRVRVDVRLDDIVLHALETEPERRYQSITEVKTDVERVGSTPAPLTTRSEPARPAKSRMPAWLTSCRFVLPLLAAFTAFSPLIASGMWAGGVGGLVTGSVLLLGLGWLVFHNLLRRDELGVQPPQRSRWLLLDNAIGAGMLAAIGIGLLYVAVLAAWERTTPHYAAGVPHPEAIWNETAARERLTHLPDGWTGIEWTRLAEPQPLSGSHELTYVEGPPWGYALGGLAFLALGAALLARVRRFARKSNAVLACVLTPLAVLLPIGIGTLWNQIWPLADGVQAYSGLASSDQLPAPAERAAQAFVDVLGERGWELIRRRSEEWRDERALEPVASHVEMELQTASPFERWRLTPEGPRRLKPRLNVRVTSAVGQGESLVSWEAGLIELGAPEHDAWAQELSDVLAEVRGRLAEGGNAAALSVHGVDPTGTWVLAFEHDTGADPGRAVLELAPDGTVTGTVSAGPEAAVLPMRTDVEGSVRGSTLTLRGTFRPAGIPAPVTLTLELAGDELTGKSVLQLPSGEQAGAVRGTREPR